MGNLNTGLKLTALHQLLNLLLQNKRTDFHETCYVALGTRVNDSLFK